MITVLRRISKKARNKARYDKRQLILDPRTETVAVERTKEVKVHIEYKTTIYYCPFCLHYGRHEEFETKTAKGKPSKKIRCPECQNGMLNMTLTEKMDAEKYAEWVFMYRSSGFWQKCPFKKWKDRLYKLGMSKKFWEKYKLLKGTAEKSETYYEYLDRSQEEWAKEQGLI